MRTLVTLASPATGRLKVTFPVALDFMIAKGFKSGQTKDPS
jgi:hypothetical protein